MADPRPCRNPRCDSEFAPVSWLDPVFCCHDCRREWCLANGRSQYGELMTPAPDPVAGLVGPPITHPAGVIPLEVEQAVTEQIERRVLAELAAAVPSAADVKVTLDHVVEVLNTLGPPPQQEPVEVTREQWELMRLTSPAPDRWPLGGTVGHLAGVLVKIVDPAPRPGWLPRLLRRLFG